MFPSMDAIPSCRFGVTQVDGNWRVHAIVRKRLGKRVFFNFARRGYKEAIPTSKFHMVAGGPKPVAPFTVRP